MPVIPAKAGIYGPWEKVLAVPVEPPAFTRTWYNVHDVPRYFASGMSHEEVLADSPHLEEDTLASLAFAAEIERRFMEEPPF